MSRTLRTAIDYRNRELSRLPESQCGAYELILIGARAIMEPDHVYELRALRCGDQGTVSGYFDDAEKLAQAATELDGKGSVYVTLNPCVPGLLKRAPNRVRRNVSGGETTSDSQVFCRYRLLVDFDPERPSGVCSTDAEKALAFEAAELMRDRLRADVADEPVLADSGNGYHLVYRIAWPNNDEAVDRVQRALQTIKTECQTPGVNVDTSVFNAARITRLYGTWNCKGANTLERPWRRSGVIQ
jgi:hypothetical protein